MKVQPLTYIALFVVLAVSGVVTLMSEVTFLWLLYRIWAGSTLTAELPMLVATAIIIVTARTTARNTSRFLEQVDVQ